MSHYILNPVSGIWYLIMRKVFKWTIRIFAGIILFCLLLTPFLFEKIDRTPYKEMPYYKEMSAQLDTFRLDTLNQKGSYFKAGWSKKNITPSYLPTLAGYGIRDKTSCLHDSVFVRVFVFDNGKNKVAFVSADLLIFPPIVEEKLREATKNMGYNTEDLYLTATHSHHAPGGWAQGPAGRVLAGKYNEEYVTLIVNAIVSAIAEAQQNLEEAEIGLGKIKAERFVRNRINMPDSKTDPWIRVFKVRKKSGKEAALISYSAHANCLKIEYTCLSGDYPAQMLSKIEKAGEVDFALYAAGMVGSHVPSTSNTAFSIEGLENEAFITTYGDSLANLINKNLDSIQLDSGKLLCTTVLDLPLREPHLKISKDWRVRPWVFNLLFGDYDPKIKILKINDVLFVGTPCDFSGELMFDLNKLCKERNIKLVITSFNGGYIGYVNVDKYYDENKGETRDMNWFGPYNQAYFTEILQRILKKI
jgi:neutral ceramidase